MSAPVRWDLPRVLIAAIMVVGLVAAMQLLQGRFDQSDLKKSAELVRNYRAGRSGPSIAEVIAARHPGARPEDIDWSSEILSSCLGHVRVYARVGPRAGAPAETYGFDVDLNGPSVHPTDPRTIEILRALERSKGSAATDAAKSATVANPAPR